MKLYHRQSGGHVPAVSPGKSAPTPFWIPSASPLHGWTTMPQPPIDACLEVEKILGIHICKNLFLCNAQKTRFYLLMMPGNKKFKTKNLSKQINSARLSFAGDEYMEQFLDITPGSVSILGLANDKENQVQLLIDSDVLKDPFLGCHPCINTSSLKIKTADLTEKFLPAVHHSYITVDLPWED